MKIAGCKKIWAPLHIVSICTFFTQKAHSKFSNRLALKQHFNSSYFSDIANQLPGVVGRDTGQIRAACLVDPLAGELKGTGHLEEGGSQLDDQRWLLLDELLHEPGVAVNEDPGIGEVCHKLNRRQRL